jgi:hypothetical protein
MPRALARYDEFSEWYEQWRLVTSTTHPAEAGTSGRTCASLATLSSTIKVLVQGRLRCPAPHLCPPDSRPGHVRRPEIAKLRVGQQVPEGRLVTLRQGVRPGGGVIEEHDKGVGQEREAGLL